MFDVLIVEDDPMVAMINKQYVMSQNNFRVCEVCRDGLSAWEFIKSNKVDLIILDQYMPQMTGLELLRKIRSEEIPVSVIMVTAANDGASIQEALRLGIVDYLVKPFANSRFNQALNAFLARQATLGEANEFNQKMIDELIGGKSPIDHKELPKGIQEATLRTIRDYLKNNAGTELTVETIASNVGVSLVTIRRYLNYLLDTGVINGRMNYETGGRPSMLYRYTV